MVTKSAGWFLGTALLLGFLVAGCASGGAVQVPVFVEFATGSTASFRALHPLDARTCWASGSGGTVLLTTDGGVTWQNVGPADAGPRDFRSLHAFSRDVAVIAVAGQPAEVWRTDDGGRHWQRVLHDADPAAFFDALAFWDDRHGLLVGDPVDGHFVVYGSDDGGRTWLPRDRQQCPTAAEGEAAFAASNGAVALHGRGGASLVTGGAASRLWQGTDHGRHWQVVGPVLPLQQGTASQGAFAVAADGQGGLVVVGGDYRAPDDHRGCAAWSADGGASVAAAATPVGGYRSSVALVPGREQVVAVGSNGSDRSFDGGRTWLPLPSLGYHVVRAAVDGSVWAAGPGGRIARLRW